MNKLKTALSLFLIWIIVSETSKLSKKKSEDDKDASTSKWDSWLVWNAGDMKSRKSILLQSFFMDPLGFLLSPLSMGFVILLCLISCIIFVLVQNVAGLI